MRIKGLVIFLSCLATGYAVADEKQIWECRTGNPGAQPILHLVEWGSRSYVKFAHLRFTAKHQLDEGNQGWYFNNDGSGYYRYGLLLEPGGKAWFHDFSLTDESGLSAPLDYFLCRQTS